MFRRLVLALLVAWWGSSTADEIVPICYGYGCIAEASVQFSEERLREINQQLVVAVDPDEERKMLAIAIGRMYGWAGEQSDIRNDRGGNYADGHAPGKMDCIDHSTSTTRLLRLLEARGSLRWHRVLDPEVRNWALIFPAHWSAVIEEKTGGEAPAVILPLDEWKKGAGPDV